MTDEHAQAAAKATEIIDTLRGGTREDAIRTLTWVLLLARHEGIAEGLNRADRVFDEVLNDISNKVGHA